MKYLNAAHRIREAMWLLVGLETVESCIKHQKQSKSARYSLCFFRLRHKEFNIQT